MLMGLVVSHLVMGSCFVLFIINVIGIRFSNAVFFASMSAQSWEQNNVNNYQEENFPFCEQF